MLPGMKFGSLLALASAGWPATALGQHTSGPSLPMCTFPKVDAPSWKQITSRIAPVTFRAPADFRWFDNPLTIESTDPQIRMRKEDWLGNTPPYFINLVRTTFLAGARPKPGMSSDRELISCLDSLGGVPVVITTTPTLRVKSGGSDTTYYADGRLGLGPGDSLRVFGGAYDPAGQALVVAIIRSVRLQTKAPK
jgi:hypothetical protein